MSRSSDGPATGAPPASVGDAVTGRVGDDVHAVLERITDAVVALDREWRYTYVNAKAAQALGRTRDQLLGRHIWTEFPDGVGQPFHLAYEQAMATGLPVQLEQYYPPFDRWFENRIYPGPDGLTIYFQDVTARKHEEAAHRAALDDLATTLQAIGDGVIATDRDGQVTRFNPAAEALTGWPAAEAQGRPLADVVRLVRAANQGRIDDPVGEVLATGGRVEHADDTELVARDGRQLPIQCVATPIGGGAGRPGGAVVVLRDRSPQMAAQRDLAINEERLRLALSSAKQGLYDLDLATGIATVTPEYATMLGHDPATFQETNAAWIERLHPDDREPVSAVYRAYVAGELPEYRVEFRQQTRTGDWRWILSIGSVVSRASDGTPLRMLGTHTDITESKQLEEARRRSEESLAITLQSIGDAVIATDAAGEITQMNGTAERLTGWTRAEAIGRPLTEVFRIIDGETRAAVDDPVRVVLATGQVVALANHTALLARDGREFQIADSAAPIRDGGGRIVGVVLVFSDVTDQYRVQQALRERETRLRTIIETEPECVKVMSASGELLEMNPAGLAMLEADTVAQARARGLLSFVVAEHREAFRDLHRAVLTGQRGVLEFEVVGLRGTRRWLETHAAPLADKSGPMLLGVTRDISARKQAEAEQRRLEGRLRIAERMEAIGQLAGGVAHDFNNLLSVINSTAELAMDGVASGTSLRDDLEEILRAGERAAVLTGQLLAFSRQQLVAPETFDLRQLLGAMRSMLARLVREDIDLRILPAEPCLVHADRGQLERVVVNLVVNARDAMPRGGTLAIETAQVVLTREQGAVTTPPLPPGPYVRASFTDTGEGMSDDTIAHVFEPFFTTKERGRGTGLGMSSSYGVVVKSGGAIVVRSERGRGSTFEVYLPLVTAPAASRAADLRPAPRSMRGTETVLIVDDEESLVRVARRILEGEGYTTLTAVAPAAALALADELQGPLHLLFTDVVMPGMSGPQLAAAITARHPETRVLYGSGYADDAVLREAVRDHAAVLLGKPYGARELLGRVRAILDRPDDSPDPAPDLDGGASGGRPPG